jgi:hypothetical protein
MIHYTCNEKDPRRWYPHPIDPNIVIEQTHISQMSHLGIEADIAQLNIQESMQISGQQITAVQSISTFYVNFQSSMRVAIGQELYSSMEAQQVI